MSHTQQKKSCLNIPSPPSHSLALRKTSCCQGGSIMGALLHAWPLQRLVSNEERTPPLLKGHWHHYAMHVDSEVNSIVFNVAYFQVTGH